MVESVRTKRKKQPSLRLLKKRAWTLLSKCIRIEASDSLGMCRCVTCGVSKPWIEMQSGHFIAGRTNSILFDERGIHVQCPACNLWRNGAFIEYFIFMEAKYGRPVIEALRALKYKTVKFDRSELLGRIEGYKRRLERLQEAA